MEMKWKWKFALAESALTSPIGEFSDGNCREVAFFATWRPPHRQLSMIYALALVKDEIAVRPPA